MCCRLHRISRTPFLCLGGKGLLGGKISKLCFDAIHGGTNSHVHVKFGEIDERQVTKMICLIRVRKLSFQTTVVLFVSITFVFLLQIQQGRFFLTCHSYAKFYPNQSFSKEIYTKMFSKVMKIMV